MQDAESQSNPVAPMAPQRPSHHRNHSNPTNQYVERRNYSQLKWIKNYKTYYQRNYTQETNSYLNTLCNCNTKKYLQQRCKCQRNWNWYLRRINDPNRTIPPLTGHTTSDIGTQFITIGQRQRTKVEEIDVYRVSKDFTQCTKLRTAGKIPCCRFAHSSNYIPTLNAILMFGGFDSKLNFNDAKLLMLDDNLTWYDLIYDAHIDFRAYHSSAARISYDHRKQQNVFECYIFGGQYCNGGPYIYHNTLFKFSFYCGESTENDEEKQSEMSSENNGWFKVDEIQYIGSDAPSQRSQCDSFIKDNYFYVFGGCDEGITFNDMWRFDLNTNVWNEIKYKGPLYAPLTHTIEPVNFRVFPARKPCYYDKQNDRMIVIHHGALSGIQREYIKYSDTVYEFQQRTLKIKQKTSLKNFSCTIFTFDLRQQQWDIIKQTVCMVPPEIKLTCFVRVGQYLVMMGGGKGIHASNYMRNLYMLKIPLYGVNNNVSWSRERLLWIGHYKSDEKCCFYNCPKQIVHLITDFLNDKAKLMHIESSNSGVKYEYEDEMDYNMLLEGVETLIGYASSNDEAQLINTVLTEDNTNTACLNEYEPRSNTVTLMGCTDIETEPKRIKCVETLMGFTNYTKK